MTPLLVPGGHFFSLWERSQAIHVVYARNGSDGQNGKDPTPSKTLLEKGNDPNRYKRQEEPQAGLDGEGRTHISSVCQLGDSSAELSTVGDDTESPNQADESQKERSVKEKTDREGTRS